MANSLFPSSLPTRQGFTLFDPANVSNTFTTPLNPLTVKRTPASVRKWTETVNGTAAVLGQTEYPPKMIQLTWPQLDKAQFDSIRAFTALAPIVMIDNNDQGFLGVLVADSTEQLASTSGWVWNCQFSFLVIAPFNGVHTTVNSLAIPTITPSVSTTGGFIPSSNTSYIWATVVTAWGESLPGPVITATSGGGTQTSSVSLSWINPTSNYYRKLRLYWNNTNNSATASWLTDVWAGQTPTFTIFTQYLPLWPKNPPTYGRAFTGYWAGSQWVNGT